MLSSKLETYANCMPSVTRRSVFMSHFRLIDSIVYLGKLNPDRQLASQDPSFGREDSLHLRRYFLHRNTALKVIQAVTPVSIGQHVYYLYFMLIVSIIPINKIGLRHFTSYSYSRIKVIFWTIKETRKWQRKWYNQLVKLFSTQYDASICDDLDKVENLVQPG